MKATTLSYAERQLLSDGDRRHLEMMEKKHEELAQEHQRLRQLLQQDDSMVPNVEGESVSVKKRETLKWFISMPRENDNFVSRSIENGNEHQDILEQLRQQSQTHDRPLLAHNITGLGGVGKTQLAAEYFYRSYAEQHYNLMLWFKVETNMFAIYQTFAREFLKLSLEGINRENAIRHINTKIQTRYKRTLIVFDNVRACEDIEDFMPNGPSNNQVHIIATSRNQLLQDSFKRIQLREFSKDEAVTYIMRYLNDEKTIRVNEEQSEPLAEALHCFPLALAQSVAYIYQSNITVVDYLNAYQSQEKLLQENRLPNNQYEQSISSVWVTQEISMKKIREQDNQGEKALELLKICAYLAADDIPRQLLVFHVETPEMVNNLMLLLQRYSLLEASKGQNAFNMHRLLQEVIQVQLQKNNSIDIVFNYICHVLSEFNNKNEKFLHKMMDSETRENVKQAEIIARHVESVLCHFGGHDVKVPLLVDLMFFISGYHQYYGNYEKALAYATEAIAYQEKHFSEDSILCAKAWAAKSRLAKYLRENRETDEFVCLLDEICENLSPLVAGEKGDKLKCFDVELYYRICNGLTGLCLHLFSGTKNNKNYKSDSYLEQAYKKYLAFIEELKLSIETFKKQGLSYLKEKSLKCVLAAAYVDLADVCIAKDPMYCDEGISYAKEGEEVFWECGHTSIVWAKNTRCCLLLKKSEHVGTNEKLTLLMDAEETGKNTVQIINEKENLYSPEFIGVCYHCYAKVAFLRGNIEESKARLEFFNSTKCGLISTGLINEVALLKDEINRANNPPLQTDGNFNKGMRLFLDVENQGQNNLKQFDRWYSTDILMYLTHQLDSHPDIFRYVFSLGDTSLSDAEQSYYKQFVGLCHLSRLLEKAVCFIGMQSITNQNHFIFGLIIDEYMLIVNPVGISRQKEFSESIGHIKRLGGLKQVYFSKDALQFDDEGLYSCGPICAELMRHISQLPFSVLLQAFESYSHSTDIQVNIHNLLLPKSLLSLGNLSDNQQAYQQQIIGIREHHFQRLSQSHLQTDDEWDTLAAIAEQQIFFDLPNVNLKKIDMKYSIEQKALEKVPDFTRLFHKHRYFTLITKKTSMEFDSSAILTMLDELINTDQRLLHCLDLKGYTGLLRAILRKNNDIAKRLIERGAPTDGGTQLRYQNALDCAQSQKNIVITSLLQTNQHGKRPIRAKNHQAFTPSFKQTASDLQAGFSKSQRSSQSNVERTYYGEDVDLNLPSETLIQIIHSKKNLMYILSEIKKIAEQIKPPYIRVIYNKYPTYREMSFRNGPDDYSPSYKTIFTPGKQPERSYASGQIHQQPSGTNFVITDKEMQLFEQLIIPYIHIQEKDLTPLNIYNKICHLLVPKSRRGMEATDELAILQLKLSEDTSASILPPMQDILPRTTEKRRTEAQSIVQNPFSKISTTLQNTVPLSSFASWTLSFCNQAKQFAESVFHPVTSDTRTNFGLDGLGPNHSFVKRRIEGSDSFLYIKNMLDQNHYQNYAPCLVLYGDTGVGKTEIIKDFFYGSSNKDRYENRLWFNAENKAKLIEQYRIICRRFNLIHQKSTEEDVICKIKGFFKEQKNWLLVYDKVSSYEELKSFFPREGRVHVIIATQKKEYFDDIPTVKIDAMTHEEGLKLLANHVHEDKFATIILTQLGYNPRLIQEAKKLIGSRGMSYREAVEGKYIDSIGLNRVEDWKEKIGALDKNDLELLNCCAFLECFCIRSDWLKELFIHKRDPAENLDGVYIVSRKRLVERYLVAFDANTEIIKIDESLQIILRKQQTREDRKKHLRRTSKFLNDKFIESMSNPSGFSEMRLICQHMQALVNGRMKNGKLNVKKLQPKTRKSFQNMCINIAFYFGLLYMFDGEEFYLKQAESCGITKDVKWLLKILSAELERKKGNINHAIHALRSITESQTFDEGLKPFLPLAQMLLGFAYLDANKKDDGVSLLVRGASDIERTPTVPQQVIFNMKILCYAGILKRSTSDDINYVIMKLGQLQYQQQNYSFSNQIEQAAIEILLGSAMMLRDPNNTNQLLSGLHLYQQCNPIGYQNLEHRYQIPSLEATSTRDHLPMEKNTMKETSKSQKSNLKLNEHSQFTIDFNAFRNSIERLDDEHIKKCVRNTLDALQKRINDFNGDIKDSFIKKPMLLKSLEDIKGVLVNVHAEINQNSGGTRSKEIGHSIFEHIEEACEALQKQLSTHTPCSSKAKKYWKENRLRLEQDLLLGNSELMIKLSSTLERITDKGRKRHSPPKGVFICYAWPNEKDEQEKHLHWVQSFLMGLRKHLNAAGLYTQLDIKDNPPGGDIYQHMEGAKKSEYVILIGTESLLKKHEKGTSAVCTELININRKREKDRETGDYKVFGLLISGDYQTSFPEHYELYTTIKNWKDKKKTYLNHLQWLIAALYKANETDFANIWDDFLSHLDEEERLVLTNGLTKESVLSKLENEETTENKDNDMRKRASDHLLENLSTKKRKTSNLSRLYNSSSFFKQNKSNYETVILNSDLNSWKLAHDNNILNIHYCGEEDVYFTYDDSKQTLVENPEYLHVWDPQASRRIYIFDLKVYCKGTVRENISLMRSKDKPFPIISPIPQSPRKLLVTRLDCKIAEIIGHLTGPIPFHKFEPNKFEIEVATQVNMVRVEEIIKSKDIGSLEALIQASQQQNDTKWVNYIFKSTGVLRGFGVHEAHIRKNLADHEYGNVVNLCVHHEFYEGLLLIIQYFPHVNVNRYDYKYGCTPLLASLRDDRIDIAEALLKAGANPNLGNNGSVSYKHKGFSPLQHAISSALIEEKPKNKKWLGFANCLLKHNADPNFYLKDAPESMLPLSVMLSFLFAATDKKIAQQLNQTLIKAGANPKLLSNNEQVQLRKITKKRRDILKWSTSIPRKNPNFIERSIDNKNERQYVLKQLSQQPQTRNQLLIAHNITGLGGVGKTQLAAEYFHQSYDEKRYDLMLWLNAESDILSDCRMFAKELLKLSLEGINREDVIRHVNTKIQTSYKRTLIVFDNVEDHKDIQDFISYSPSNNQVHIIVTSRNQLLPSLFDRIQLEDFSKDEAIAYIKRYLNKGETTRADEKQFGLLAKKLHYSPLALAQAMAYISQNHESIDSYLYMDDQSLNELLNEANLPTPHTNFNRF